MSSQCVLVADIGGTHARFALADPAAPAPLLDDSISQQSVDAHATLADAARAYLHGRGADVHRAVLAIAGPVHEGPVHEGLRRDDQVHMTNHPWEISSAGLREALALDEVLLMNDFAAQAMAIQLLSDKDLLDIGAPTRSAQANASRTCVILGPGTGLGVAVLLHRDGHDIAMATEGGHIGFAPGTPDEAAVLQHLTARYGRVSNERLLSGDGLINLHRALRAISGDAGDAGLQAKQITTAATAGDACCTQAVAMFCAILGTVAGDLVLAYGAWDGAYLSGGILQYLVPALRESDFLHRFRDKGRYAGLLARVPIRVVLHPQPGLLGAAAMARSMTGSTGR